MWVEMRKQSDWCFIEKVNLPNSARPKRSKKGRGKAAKQRRNDQKKSPKTLYEKPEKVFSSSAKWTAMHQLRN